MEKILQIAIVPIILFLTFVLFYILLWISFKQKPSQFFLRGLDGN